MPPLRGSGRRGDLFDRAGQEPITILRYRLVRVWQVPVDQLLAGGVGTLPLAPISDLHESRVPDDIRRMKERLNRERRRQWVADLWAATYVLLGLRYSDAFADMLFREVLTMEESATYQAIVRKGRLAEARKFVILIGEDRLGPPSEAAAAAINALQDPEQLGRLGKRALHVGSWQELLGTPPRRRRNGRRGDNA
jgi:hypothetical protein